MKLTLLSLMHADNVLEEWRFMFDVVMRVDEFIIA